MSRFEYATHPNSCAGDNPILLLFCGDKVKIVEDGSAGLTHWMTVGFFAGRGVVAGSVDEADDTYTTIRQLQADLPQQMLKAVNRATQLIAWRKNFRFCSRCGGETKLNDYESAMSCTCCSANFYPRLDPAIIVGVLKGDKILLAHNKNFLNNMYGLVAGYIEGGETLEEAVAREVMEEVGVDIENIRYFQSQMWPSSQSLMFGCFADYKSGEVTPDGTEIIDAGFFSADNLPNIPSAGAVARKIIDHWQNEILPEIKKN